MKLTKFTVGGRNLDSSKIPKGMYCYCSGGCPYHKIIPHMYIKFDKYNINVHYCEYLNINSMTLMLNGEYYESWLLTDQCKPCNINMEAIYD